MHQAQRTITCTTCWDTNQLAKPSVQIYGIENAEHNTLPLLPEGYVGVLLDLNARDPAVHFSNSYKELKSLFLTYQKVCGEEGMYQMYRTPWI